jgi:methionyl-tRNA formyltransferase
VRIVFWGTPEFALPAFRALVGEGHDIVAVVTQPDRPAGRRRELRPSPVKLAAVEEGIEVAQPERARGEEFVGWLAEQSADLNIVVAYGQILRREVLDAAALGSINVHASLLPELRGAAPIQWAIARGCEATGVTVMRMEEKLDAGPILLQVREPIGPDETGAELTARLSEIGAEALVEALALLEIGELDDAPQDESKATYAPLVTRGDTRIDWSKAAKSVACQVRAFDDAPGAWTSFEGSEIKMYRPIAEPGPGSGLSAGSVIEGDPMNAPRGIRIACGDGAVCIREVKPAGRRRMLATEWLHGRPLEAGSRFE